MLSYNTPNVELRVDVINLNFTFKSWLKPKKGGDGEHFLCFIYSESEAVLQSAKFLVLLRI